MRRKRIVLFSLLTALACVLLRCTAMYRAVSIPDQQPFDIDADGLVLVQTVHESNQTIKNYVLASEQRKMDTEPFAPDSMQVYTVDSFSIWIMPASFYSCRFPRLLA